MFPTYQNQFQAYQQYQPMMMPQMPTQAPQIASQQQRSPIAGRIVKGADEIAPSEVPMDGTVALFPVQDGSLIYAKGWNTDGTISTIEYAPVTHPSGNDDAVSMPTLADIADQLNDIQDMLKEQKKPAPKRTATKKEAADDAE